MAPPDELTQSSFAERAERGLGNPFLRRAIPSATDHTVEALYHLYADADRDALRTLGSQIKSHAIANLNTLLPQLAEALEANGAVVHYAADGAEARRIAVEICTAEHVRLAIKAKSMLAEEIALNPALEAAGVEVVETDLGEYVVQLDGDRPSHVIAPIIHKTRGEVRELFSRHAGRELRDDPTELTAYAREQLRDVFLRADCGITGGNFAIAETGTICLVTNEGNGRLATSLPRVQISLVGIEKVVARTDDLAVMLPLLVGHGTGQRISNYVTLVSGPRRDAEPEGPEAMHVILVDNGRGQVAQSDYREVLNCIRCGACQNICPVYRQVGGHAYGWVYGGPIGAVLTPLFRGQEEGGELSHATSLCGACDDICPVRIPLHDLLLSLRRDRVGAGVPTRRERLAYAVWSRLWASPTLYRLSARVGRVGALPIRRVRNGPVGRWTRGRELPVPDRRPFHRRGD